MSCLCQDRFKQTTADIVEEKPRVGGFFATKFAYVLIRPMPLGPAVWLGPTCVVRENVVRRAASKVFATEPEQVGSRQSRERPSGVAPGRPLLSPPGGGPYGDITLLRIFRVQL